MFNNSLFTTSQTHESDLQIERFINLDVYTNPADLTFILDLAKKHNYNTLAMASRIMPWLERSAIKGMPTSPAFVRALEVEGEAKQFRILFALVIANRHKPLQEISDILNATYNDNEDKYIVEIQHEITEIIESRDDTIPDSARMAHQEILAKANLTDINEELLSLSRRLKQREARPCLFSSQALCATIMGLSAIAAVYYFYPGNTFVRKRALSKLSLF